MNNTSANIEANSSSSLPTLNWVKTGSNINVTLRDGITNGITDTYAAKVPLISDQELINSGRLRVQYGRLSSRDYKPMPTPHIRERRIKWYASSCPGCEVFASGEVGGGSSISGNRPNMFVVTQQNDIVGNVPFWDFYDIKGCSVFNGIPALSGITNLEDVPYMTGNPARDGIYFPDRFLPGGSHYNTRPERAMFRQRHTSESYWFCRLVVMMEDNPQYVEYYGPVSEPLIVKPNEVGFDEHFMVSALSGYSFSGFNTTIIDKYKQ